ncbi:MAG: hypothetical protein ACXVCE_09705, partial [Bacteriovorax sp.]
NSPSISGAAYDFAPYIGLFKQDSLKNDAILGLLNSVIAPASKNVSEKNWVISPGSCELKGK